MTNEEIIEQINAWQSCDSMHPLTCSIDSDHEILKPVIENDKVVLICPTCSYKQTNIPKCCLKGKEIAKEQQVLKQTFNTLIEDCL